MTPYLSDADFTLYQGDSLEVLRGLPDESVHCVVTSPPYWGLRDYGTGTWEGGDPDCDHATGRNARNDGDRNGADGFAGNRNLEGHADMGALLYREECGKCGARRVDQQLGLEPTPDQYVANMVSLFREVRRVLRRDGTCWLNLGDSYAGGGGGNYGDGISVRNRKGIHPGTERGTTPKPNANVSGLKPKDLVGIPWRVAFALQADGWYLRSDIIWAKPNPMPESVTDRPTKAHEYLFLLTRSSRYFYDADAIRESYTDPREGGEGFRWYSERYTNQKPTQSNHTPTGRGPDGRRKTSVQAADGSIQHRDGERWPNPSGRNARSVWEIATQPYPEAHFATFPEELARRCIAAGCPQDGVVLDPFMGSGTTAKVARKLGRRSIGIELNPDYCELAARRLSQQSLLAQEEVA